MNKLTANRRCPARRAFTLMEVILAVAMSAALLTGVMSLQSSATDTRNSLMADAQRSAARRLVMDRLTTELAAAVVYPFINLGLEGQTDNVSFITACLPGQAAWAVRNITEAPISPEFDLQKLVYRPSTVTDDNGLARVVGIERTCQKIVAAKTAQEGVEIQVQFITSQFKFIRLRYWDDSSKQWMDSWNQRDLPLGVEVSLGAEPLPENTDPVDYPYEVHSRIIYLPGGKKAMESSSGSATTQGASQ
ncbi:MAG: hypothetical protein HZA50_02345 [Planctomycetes bacterium]|nr:hypothetical protein [Planctomycetota bacterium]